MIMDNNKMTNLISSVLEGQSEISVIEARHLLEAGTPREDIVIYGLEEAMSKLDAKCTLEQFNLLEIMLSGRAVMDVMKLLYPTGITTAAQKGTVVIATLEGDVHDLGKNILKMVLIASGYRVVDCGKDCPLQKLMDTVEKETPLAIGISGLITPVIPQVKKIKDSLSNRKLSRVKVIAGGAALKQSSPENLNVDLVSESAFDCLHYLEKISRGR
jgi:dimethylamine corrinoid protein